MTVKNFNIFRKIQQRSEFSKLIIQFSIKICQGEIREMEKKRNDVKKKHFFRLIHYLAFSRATDKIILIKELSLTIERRKKCF